MSAQSADPITTSSVVDLWLESVPDVDPLATVRSISVPNPADPHHETVVVEQPPSGQAVTPHFGPGQVRGIDASQGQIIEVVRPGGELYRLGCILGRGGQGEVYEANQLDLDRSVAIKCANNRPEALRDFLTEANTIARLDHPNIVPIHSTGIIKIAGREIPMLVMKRIHGRSWRDLIIADRGHEDFDRETFLARHLSIFLHVLQALAYAHDRGIIHRDLKPAQVMVGSFGEVYLGDWGLAVQVDSGTETPSPDFHGVVNPFDTIFKRSLPTVLSASNPAGTPCYMAPEQVIPDPKRLSRATDVYLAGAVLYEIVAGQPPHNGPDLVTVIRQAQSNVYRPVPTETPEELASLIAHCLATDPAQRPTVTAVAETISAFLSGSSRREHSRSVTRSLLDAAPTDSYAVLSDRARLVSDAALHWPDNPLISTCRDAVLANYVTVALARKDLAVAQIQLYRIQDPALAAKLQEDVDAELIAAERALTRPRLLRPRRIVALVGSILGISALVILVQHLAVESIEREMLSKASTVADLAARTIKAADLESVDRERRIYSPEFQRVANQLLPYRRANSDISHIATMRPNNTNEEGWQTLVDADHVDIDLNMDGKISESEKGRAPGYPIAEVLPAARVALETRQPTSIALPATDERPASLAGFAAVSDASTVSPAGIVMVEIPQTRVQERMASVRYASLVVGLILSVAAIAALLSIFSAQRALEMVDRFRDRLNKQNQEIRTRNINLG